jgi:hypothetical protein
MSYCCAAHDPLVRAGAVHCAGCGDRHPVDAGWLTDGLALVNYSSCEHRPAETWVVSVADLDEHAPRCQATTRQGRACRARPRRGVPYCTAHGG